MGILFIDDYRKNESTPKKDLLELWKRVVFSMAVSNTDDYFRNHGFILTKKGWILSPLYDVNPVPYGDELALNVTEHDNRLSLNLALELANILDIPDVIAKKEIANILKTVKDNWVSIAYKYGISRSSIEEMKHAFI